MSHKPLTVTVLTDTHYYCKENGTSGKAYDIANAKSQKLLADSPEVLESAFSQIIADKDSDIVLISGDLTNNGELNAHAEFIEMLRNLKNNGKRVYVITATHDFRKNEVADLYCGDERLQTKAASSEFRKGDMVNHKAFGRGMIISMTPMGGDALIEILFDGIGKKRLMLRAASMHMTKE